MTDLFDDLVKEFDKIKRYEEALKFYANEDNYDDDGAPFKIETSHECVHEFRRLDLGEIARNALK